MRRNVRKVCQVTIISSSSEDDCQEISSDDDYIPKQTISKGTEKKKRPLIESNDVSTKSKQKKMEDALAPKEKKQKLTKSNIAKNEEQKNKKSNLEDKINRTFNTDFNSAECREWTDVEYVSEANNISKSIAENVIKLFNDDNTIPFIARYRKNMTGGMEPDTLRALKESFELAKAIKHRASVILKAVDRLGHWTPNVHAAITSAQTLDDLEHIYSYFKPSSTRTLAERARDVGLGPISDLLLSGKPLPQLQSLIDPEKKGLESVQQIKDGIIHILSDVLSKCKAVFDQTKVLEKQYSIEIKSTKCKTKQSMHEKQSDSDGKYEMYYDFSMNIRTIRPHQILAINRGEAQKILNVKIVLSESLKQAFTEYCLQRYKHITSASNLHSQLFTESIDYAYTKFIKPVIIRRVRSELKQKAEVASIEVFVTNVKQLLLVPPVRGKVIVGIDPGFYHGCKLAVISEQGKVLETGVIYPHKKSQHAEKEAANNLIDLINRHNSTILALGNATACRETELFLAKVIKSKELASKEVAYVIVDESGASIYSCGTEAKAEFPDMDPNIISAISIARRLQDPLAELVKVEPKNLGVGMYQHDLPEKQLLQALEEVVSEAVSFVGVDVNTASRCLLKRVAGLNLSRAQKIIEWRTQCGPFKNRQQLLDVKGIGNKTFEQCAGFVRIVPETSSTSGVLKSKANKKSKTVPNLLDQTWIHPESYEIAQQFLKHCNCNLKDLGTPAFIEQIKTAAGIGSEILAEKFSTDVTNMELIIKGLSMRKDEDIRLKENYPLFRVNTLSINDLEIGQILTGAVRNVTHFGAFTDVGVGRNGLIPIRWIKNQNLSIGQRVEVKVSSLELQRGRIGLELIKVL